jgi:hypothetical protein
MGDSLQKKRIVVGWENMTNTPIFIPIIIPSAPEQPDFQSTLKIPLSQWENAKEKILNVLKGYDGLEDAKYDDKERAFMRSRSLSYGAAIGFAVITFFSVLMGSLGGQLPLTHEVAYSYYITSEPLWLNVVALFIVLPVIIGIIMGKVWTMDAHGKYIPVDWITVREGKNAIYVEFEDGSKSWLNRFMDELSDEGLHLEAKP